MFRTRDYPKYNPRVWWEGYYTSGIPMDHRGFRLLKPWRKRERPPHWGGSPQPWCLAPHRLHLLNPSRKQRGKPPDTWCCCTSTEFPPVEYIFTTFLCVRGVWGYVDPTLPLPYHIPPSHPSLTPAPPLHSTYHHRRLYLKPGDPPRYFSRRIGNGGVPRIEVVSVTA